MTRWLPMTIGDCTGKIGISTVRCSPGSPGHRSAPTGTTITAPSVRFILEITSSKMTRKPSLKVERPRIAITGFAGRASRTFESDSSGKWLARLPNRYPRRRAIAQSHSAADTESAARKTVPGRVPPLTGTPPPVGCPSSD